jgi:hypothetical protein
MRTVRPYDFASLAFIKNLKMTPKTLSPNASCIGEDFDTNPAGFFLSVQSRDELRIVFRNVEIYVTEEIGFLDLIASDSLVCYGDLVDCLKRHYE